MLLLIFSGAQGALVYAGPSPKRTVKIPSDVRIIRV